MLVDVVIECLCVRFVVVCCRVLPCGAIVGGGCRLLVRMCRTSAWRSLSLCACVCLVACGYVVLYVVLPWLCVCVCSCVCGCVWGVVRDWVRVCCCCGC